MYKYLFVILFLTAFSCNGNKKRPELKLSAYTYDFGHIVSDSLYRGSAVIKNTGEDTLRIFVMADCGCTGVGATKNNIAPGDTSLLSFSYDTSGKYGPQDNYITITANTDSLVHLLQISAYVADNP